MSSDTNASGGVTMATYEVRMTAQAILRADVWDASDKHCHYCGKELHPLRDFCIDHVVPKCAGGTDAIDNLVAACRPCNLKKGVTSDKAYCRRWREEQREKRRAGHTDA